MRKCNTMNQNFIWHCTGHSGVGLFCSMAMLSLKACERRGMGRGYHEMLHKSLLNNMCFHMGVSELMNSLQTHHIKLPDLSLLKRNL